VRRQQLERHLVEHRCVILRDGTRHAIWHNPEADARVTLPWHSEIPGGAARTICRQLAVPLPPSRG
jgi:hypothetical protein